VCGLQVVIWNAGSQAIRPNNILDDVIIRTKPTVPILEARIRKTSRNVCAIAINADSEEEGAIPIRWNILEERDGATIELFYIGDPSIDVTVTGTVEGRKSPRRITYAEATNLPRPAEFFSGALAGSLVALAFITGGIFFQRTTDLPIRRTFSLIGIVFVVSVLVLILGWSFLWIRAPKLPYPF
jgi:hypothetical protein